MSIILEDTLTGALVLFPEFVKNIKNKTSKNEVIAEFSLTQFKVTVMLVVL